MSSHVFHEIYLHFNWHTKGDLALKKTRESKYGNEIYYAETSTPAQPELHFDLEYEIVREKLSANHFYPTPLQTLMYFRKS